MCACVSIFLFLALTFVLLAGEKKKFLCGCEGSFEIDKKQASQNLRLYGCHFSCRWYNHWRMTLKTDMIIENNTEDRSYLCTMTFISRFTFSGVATPARSRPC